MRKSHCHDFTSSPFNCRTDVLMSYNSFINIDCWILFPYKLFEVFANSLLMCLVYRMYTNIYAAVYIALNSEFYYHVYDENPSNNITSTRYFNSNPKLISNKIAQLIIPNRIFTITTSTNIKHTNQTSLRSPSKFKSPQNHNYVFSWS